MRRGRSRRHSLLHHGVLWQVLPCLPRCSRANLRLRHKVRHRLDRRLRHRVPIAKRSSRSSWIYRLRHRLLLRPLLELKLLKLLELLLLELLLLELLPLEL